MHKENDLEDGGDSSPEQVSDPVVAVEATGEPTCEFVWSEDIYAARLAARQFNASMEDN